MRISYWSSDVCSSDLLTIVGATSGDTGSAAIDAVAGREKIDIFMLHPDGRVSDVQRRQMTTVLAPNVHNIAIDGSFDDAQALVKAMFNDADFARRSEEHTSELQSLMRISYAVFCLKKNTNTYVTHQ